MSLPGAPAPNSRARRRSASHDSDRDSKSLASQDAGRGSQVITIDLKDEEDDVQVLTPRATAQFLQARNSRRNRHRTAAMSTDGGDSKLRHGASGNAPNLFQGTSSSNKAAVGGLTRVSRSTTIDLTSGNDDELTITASGKRKSAQSITEPSKEMQLTCAICMDKMKEETSTVCGHLFCRACILAAIASQKKCPTCRRKLTNNNIHRVFLPNITT